MDRTMLRQQALNLATMKARADASTDDILRDADKILDWLTKDVPAAEGEKAEPAPSEPAAHESAVAVEGQEPKGE